MQQRQAEEEERAYQAVLRAEVERLRGLHKTSAYQAKARLDRFGVRIGNFIGGGVVLLLAYVVIRHVAPHVEDHTLGSLTVDELFWMVFAVLMGVAMFKVAASVMFAEPPGPERLEKQIHEEASVVAVSSRPDDIYEVRKPRWNLDGGRKSYADAWKRIYVQVYDTAMANGGRITNKEIREICAKEQNLREFARLLILA